MDNNSLNVLTPVIIAIIGSQAGIVIAMLATLLPMAIGVGRLPGRREHNELKQEVAGNKDELKRDIAELRREAAENKDELKRDIAELRQEAAENKDELKDIIAETRRDLEDRIADTRRELDTKIDRVKVDLEDKIDNAKNEVLHEIRRSQQQIMLALVNHTHRDDGQPVFTLPPDIEPAPSPADN